MMNINKYNKIGDPENIDASRREKLFCFYFFDDNLSTDQSEINLERLLNIYTACMNGCVRMMKPTFWIVYGMNRYEFNTLLDMII